MKVRTLQSHPYAGITREPGDIYEMEDKFVEVMTTVGCVTTVIETTRLAGPSNPTTRDMTPEKPAKNYKRRDVRTK